MGKRDPAHQQRKESSALATGWGSTSVVGIPLLPYEWQLIRELGCTEEEYKTYKKSLINYGTRRPSAYSTVPDIRCDPTGGILTSLIIGIALSAVSALLAPKPKKPEQKENKSKKLADDVSQTRFNTTQGFDGAQEIAKLGAPVPLFFGKYVEGESEPPTGGLSIAPQLVWSRMFSYGNHQGFKGLYVVGEVLDTAVDRTEQIDRPDLAGIQIGTVPLSTLPPEQYAVYWRSNFFDGRIKRSNLIYGTQSQPAAGDPNEFDDVFNCPIKNQQTGLGFSMTSSPSGDSAFGVFAPVRNGTGWKLNFRIIPYPDIDDQSDEANNRILSERSLIVGHQNRRRGQGMRGLGAAWSPMMGIISINGQTADAPLPSRLVQVNDEIEYKIRGTEGNKANFGVQMFGTKSDSDDVDGEEINNRLKSMRADADTALQVGSLFMIGRTVWQVMRRNGGENGVWNSGGPDVNVTLKCVELTTNDGASAIGIAGQRALAYSDTFQVWDGYKDAEASRGWCGPAFWPLLQISFTVIKNTRPVDCTEFGLRSQVWNQANGLCNFPSLTTPKRLAELEDDGYTITNGITTRYFRRSSCFTIYLRPVGAQPNGQPYKWQFLGETFVVSGDSPVDQFNFIRMKTNDGPRQMEFRFIPRSFSDIRFYVSKEEVFWRLNAKTGQEIGKTFNTPYGSWRVTIVGDLVTAGQLYPNSELVTGKQPNTKTEYTQVTAVEFVEFTPSQPTVGRRPAFDYECFGDPDSNAGKIKSFEKDAFTNSGKKVTLFFRSRSIPSPFADYSARYNKDWFWAWEPTLVVRSDEGIRNGEQLHCQFTSISSGNIFALQNGLFRVGQKLKVTDVGIVVDTEPGADVRAFETSSQLAEVSLYEELKNSCQAGPEHSITYVNESVGSLKQELNFNDAPTYPYTMMGLSMRSNTLLNSIDQLRIWLQRGQSTRFNDPKESELRGPTNNFADIVNYVLTNEAGGLGQYISPELIDYPSLETSARFLNQNKLRYDGSISDRTNARDYLTQIAPFFLCNFVIKNGIFGVEPALPIDSEGNITPNNISITNIFNESTIIDGSYKLSYLDISQRQDFQAVISYRTAQRDSPPSTETITMRWNEDGSDLYPQEEIDLSGFCTSRSHAEMVGRFLLSIRRLIDHTIQFETAPDQLGIQPGSYILINTSVSPQSSTTNAVINPVTGAILSTEEVSNGTYTVTMYTPGNDTVEVVDLEILNGKATNKSYWGGVYSTLVPNEEQNVYAVEQVELTDGGLAQVTASHFPAIRMGSGWTSSIADHVKNGNSDTFYVEV